MLIRTPSSLVLSPGFLVPRSNHILEDCHLLIANCTPCHRWVSFDSHRAVVSLPFVTRPRSPTHVGGVDTANPPCEPKNCGAVSPLADQDGDLFHIYCRAQQPGDGPGESADLAKLKQKT